MSSYTYTMYVTTQYRDNTKSKIVHAIKQTHSIALLNYTCTFITHALDYQ